ncbi:GNAT family N-acetyltransferase [Oscillatoria sp. FACHB-1406]|uniref:GNAT family N-acetyltransferase n=1 Tax=Oscillatoria sp. FACHB-1406 TaxID=2692846 RepID=UPI001686B34B|nr:GNAT family N-acetyltransferase [Oscillatoria sp. FACHB-1406]MBD2576076.1 GNAT family N-acetyltransferase [Oscillatoria sp. FACHB-1406]
MEGCGRDRALLLRFLTRSYQELFPENQEYSHLATTVERYFSSETPLWWVVSGASLGAYGAKIAGLWMGNAIAQAEGDRYAHIFLLYVVPEYRCRGIGSALMQKAEDWARRRGDRQIGLQVFCENRPALSLYRRLGYQEQSLLMVKQLLDSSQ